MNRPAIFVTCSIFSFSGTLLQTDRNGLLIPRNNSVQPTLTSCMSRPQSGPPPDKPPAPHPPSIEHLMHMQCHPQTLDLIQTWR
ncbi:hypothetical protein ACN38_g3752 [Penicillium nordicum]|uniref:Uncharacterized protein n=1 Tax=Penicillium nordicum TaxID=229535 RepID=A0A0M8PD88_9EURO|nr:hypothetical protein ACN38_g3752 [Penicillium nordicum]